MKLVYYSSVLNHHQRALCDAFYTLLRDDFLFVETMDMEHQRIKLGYQKEKELPYVLKSYINEENRQTAFKEAIESDVLLGAVFPVEILYERMKKNKLTFRHIETYFKRSKLRLLTPNALRIAYKEHFRYRNKQLYLLCASSHVAKDVKIFGAYPKKKFKWGYFPITECNSKPEKRNADDKIEIIWVGRMISWKNPEYAIEVIKYLKKKNYNIHLNMIGIGDLQSTLQKKIIKYKLEGEITMCGAMPPQEVRKRMTEADIFMFTSTKEEGWGAVLNEAMSSRCAVVASKEAGSTGYLIKDEVNGLVYCNNSCKELKKKVEKLCLNKKLREELAEAASSSIEVEWNYNVAAKRFIKVAEALLNNDVVPAYLDGPMSEG